MFKLSKRSAALPQTEAGESVMHAANSSKAAIDIQKELIRVAFKDTRRNTGVPSAWLDCEVHYHPGPEGTECVQVHLVMNEWSGHLLRYAMAFQTQFLMCLDRYEPNVDHAGIEWLWKFAPDCACPFPTMPAPEEWAQKLAARKGKTLPIAAAVAAARKQLTTASKGIPTDNEDKRDRQFDLRDVFSDLKG